MRLAKSALITIALLPMIEGCHVPLRQYRLNNPAIIVPPEFTGPQPTKAEEIAKLEKPCLSAQNPICLAFIEVDDMGELFAKGELDTALGAIRRANDLAAEKPDQAAPVVITFAHGWKNNAAEDNANVKGFKLSLQAVYQRLQELSPNRKIHVIGIYIGWRGNLINKAWPVTQQFSFYNREAAATRVPGARLSSALTQIATRTHENKDALAIYIGHSFGGLLLERSVSEATASQIAQATIFADEGCNALKDSPEAQQKIVAAKSAADSRADLVIFINPAGAATEAKQMLDFMTNNSFRYQPYTRNVDCPDPSTKLNNEDDRPLFVSITSTSDLATKVALPIGHAWPELKFKSAGSFRNLGSKQDKERELGQYGLDCFDPHNTVKGPHWTLTTKEDGAQPQSAYYMSSAPHMQVLQSHVMLKQVGANQMQVASTGQKMNVNPDAIARCDRNLFDKDLHIISTFRLYNTQTCFAVQERPNRCNGTPYWLMEVDPDVVPDHSTIFTDRFIGFLMDTFFMPGGHPMQRLSPRMMQTSH